MDRPNTAAQLLLRAFRWTHGNADFADALRDPELLAAIGPALAGPFAPMGVTAVVAPEARGFVVGGLVAREMGVGLVLARKPGAVHPDSDGQVATGPDWRGRHVEILISRRAVRSGDRLLLVDDWIDRKPSTDHFNARGPTGREKWSACRCWSTTLPMRSGKS